VLAYLIIKATIRTVIPSNNIAKIGYSVDLEVTDNSGKKAQKDINHRKATIRWLFLFK